MIHCARKENFDLNEPSEETTVSQKKKISSSHPSEGPASSASDTIGRRELRCVTLTCCEREGGDLSLGQVSQLHEQEHHGAEGGALEDVHHQVAVAVAVRLCVGAAARGSKRQMATGITIWTSTWFTFCPEEGEEEAAHSMSKLGNRGGE
jgi:hypothetical protein